MSDVLPLFPHDVLDDVPDASEDTSSMVGRVGEGIVIAWLSRQGLLSRQVDFPHTDLVVPVPGRMLRVEVKTCGFATTSGHQVTPAYIYTTAQSKSVYDKDQKARRNIGRVALTLEHCDIIAGVCLDVERILFWVPDGRGTVRKKPKELTYPDCEGVTWRNCLDQLEIGLGEF